MSTSVQSPRQSGLLVFQLAILAQVVLYWQILSLFLRLRGTWSDVGSNFLGFWLFAIVPCFVLLAILASLGYRRIDSRHPRRRGQWLACAWAVDGLLLVGSVVLYASHLHA